MECPEWEGTHGDHQGQILAPIKPKAPTKRCCCSWNSALGRILLFLEQLKKKLGKFGILMTFRTKCGDLGNVFQLWDSTWRHPAGEEKCVFWAFLKSGTGIRFCPACDLLQARIINTNCLDHATNQSKTQSIQTEVL